VGHGCLGSFVLRAPGTDRLDPLLTHRDAWRAEKVVSEAKKVSAGPQNPDGRARAGADEQSRLRAAVMEPYEHRGTAGTRIPRKTELVANADG
jgi:hypothetical protein